MTSDLLCKPGSKIVWGSFLSWLWESSCTRRDKKGEEKIPSGAKIVKFSRGFLLADDCAWVFRFLIFYLRCLNERYHPNASANICEIICWALSVFFCFRKTWAGQGGCWIRSQYRCVGLFDCGNENECEVERETAPEFITLVRSSSAIRVTERRAFKWFYCRTFPLFLIRAASFSRGHDNIYIHILINIHGRLQSALPNPKRKNSPSLISPKILRRFNRKTAIKVVR